MDTEMTLRIIAITIAAIILASNINLTMLINYVKNLVPKKVNVVTPSVVVPNNNINFLDIVNLWFQLKEKCETYGLSEAVEKLDEVFPLLNVENKDV